jgi:hypothetical protein
VSNDLPPSKPNQPDMARGMLRYMGIMLLIYGIAIICGLAFFLIVFGILSTVRRLALYWNSSL